MKQRILWGAPLAVLASVGVHVLAALLVVGAGLWGGWPAGPTTVEITPMQLEDLQDLPLGGPAAGDALPDRDAVAMPRPPPEQAAAAPTPGPGGERARRKERTPSPPRPALSDVDGGAAPPRPTSVRSYAPAGSRVTALLRVDRLRGTSYAPVVDQLLMHLPDRRDLLEGTDIDLYQDIDAVLIATPNPLDARATFLAARHRMTDTALRAALERGARATRRKLAWRTERGRPFAERRSADTSPNSTPGNRDARLILLPAPGLVVVTPPAYRSLILGPRVAAAAPGGAGGVDGNVGAGGNADNVGGAGGQGVSPASSRDDPQGWTRLLRRIDAEDSVLPPDAVAMVSAVDLFSARGLRGALNVAPGTRGSDGDEPGAVPMLFGLPVPRSLTATLGIAPQPFADIDAEFATEAEALLWEQEWPVQRRRLLSNPLIVLSGFSGLIGGATLTRTAQALHAHVDATELQTVRLLQLIAAQLSALGR